MAEEGMGEQRGTNTATLGTQTDQSFPAQREMTDDGMGEGGKINTLPVDTYPQSNSSSSSSPELLAGIPDQIVLDEIVPRLQRRDFHVLSCVNSSWLEAIQNHRVYDARVVAKSTETLLVHIHCWEKKEAIALYSIIDERCFELPPIPQLVDRVPPLCEIISLDGKVYVLGGAGPHNSASNAVFVWDVAGQRQWKQCARMKHPRQEFGCGILDGKIYVFGGSAGDHPSFGSEVYDPKVNEWSPIKSMPSWRYNHQVTTIGEDFVVYGGKFYEPDYNEWYDNGLHVDLDDPQYGDNGANGHIDPRDLVKFNANGTHTGEVAGHVHTALSLDIYNPRKDEWRVVESFGTEESQLFFVVKGKFYEMGKLGFQVYDMERNSWRKQVRKSSGRRSSGSAFASASLAVNESLFVRAHLKPTDGSAEKSRVHPSETALLVQSEGFNSESNEIVWRRTNCQCWSNLQLTSMCTIQL